MAEKQRALAPIEQRRVDFYGDTLTGYLVEVGGERREVAIAGVGLKTRPHGQEERGRLHPGAASSTQAADDAA